MKLDAKFWGVALLVNIAGGVIVWWIVSQIGKAKQTKRDEVSEILDSFAGSN